MEGNTTAAVAAAVAAAFGGLIQILYPRRISLCQVSEQRTLQCALSKEHPNPTQQNAASPQQQCCLCTIGNKIASIKTPGSKKSIFLTCLTEMQCSMVPGVGHPPQMACLQLYSGLDVLWKNKVLSCNKMASIPPLDVGFITGVIHAPTENTYTHTN